jgi:hypothetical protein
VNAMNPMHDRRRECARRSETQNCDRCKMQSFNMAYTISGELTWIKWRSEKIDATRGSQEKYNKQAQNEPTVAKLLTHFIQSKTDISGWTS